MPTIDELAANSGHLAAINAVLEKTHTLFPTMDQLDNQRQALFKTFFEGLSPDTFQHEYWKKFVENAKQGTAKPWQIMDALENVSYPSLSSSPKELPLTFENTPFLPYAEKLADGEFNQERTKQLHQPYLELLKTTNTFSTAKEIQWHFLKSVRTLIFRSWKRYISDCLTPLYTAQKKQPQEQQNPQAMLNTLKELLQILQHFENNPLPDEELPKKLKKTYNCYIENYLKKEDFQHEAKQALIQFKPLIEHLIRNMEIDFSHANKARTKPILTKIHYFLFHRPAGQPELKPGTKSLHFKPRTEQQGLRSSKPTETRPRSKSENTPDDKLRKKYYGRLGVYAEVIKELQQAQAQRPRSSTCST